LKNVFEFEKEKAQPLTGWGLRISTLITTLGEIGIRVITL
jgi:hypothetical protein